MRHKPVDDLLKVFNAAGLRIFFVPHFSASLRYANGGQQKLT